jgi:ABC-type transport system involved in multi-copper enzyme maturation permease subunit
MKTFTIALTTAREAVRQPLFFLLAILCSVVLVIATIVPYFTFGEDIKMLKDCGMAAILIFGMLLALLTASNTIAEDIEHRTAITLLSKPINRRQFIVGKFFGIVAAVAMLFVILAIVFSLTTMYKVGYDLREGGYRPDGKAATDASQRTPTFAMRFREVRQALPGLVLTFFQVVVISALSVAVSTRMPMVVNIVVCGAVFVLGHLAPILVQESKGGFELFEFFARLLDLLLPALEFFNVAPAVATGSRIPLEYVLLNLLYCVLYSSAAIMLAFILFEDRDLA